MARGLLPYLSTGRASRSPSPVPPRLRGRVGVEVGVVVASRPHCELTRPVPALPHKGGGNAVAPALESGTLRNVFAGRKATPDPADELPFWRRKAMKDMTPAEWESLCDGCGRCCLNKLQEEGSDRTYYTDVGCKLLDGQTCRCTDYANRSAQGEGLRHAHLAQHQPHLMAAADLRLQARGGGQGFVLVASAGVGRPGDGARGRACRCAARWARARSMCRTRIWRIIS